jgi:hypothetical protein
MEDLSPRRIKRNPSKTEERIMTRLKKSKASWRSKRTRSILKLDEYKGPIIRSKSKKISILRSEKSILKVSPHMEVRDEQPQDEHHEERQGGGRYSTRNQGIPGFNNRRRVRDSLINIIGEKHEIPVVAKGNLQEFSANR